MSYAGRPSDPSSPPLGPLPLKSALKTDEDGDRTPPASGSLKAVQIAEPVQEFPLVEDWEPEPSSLRQFRAGSSRRLGGRPASICSMGEGSPRMRPWEEPSESAFKNKRPYHGEKLLAQVGEWLERERGKASRKRSKKKPTHRRKSLPPQDEEPLGRPRSDSADSQSSEVSLDKLERILEDSMSSLGLTKIPNLASRPARRRRSSTASSRRMSLQRHHTASSDTDFMDGDAIVPSCDAWLDNSKTLSYSIAGGNASTEDLSSLDGLADTEREAWTMFKNEILRIAHTLRLKGWRRIPLGSGQSLTVQRLSGALTNAVYVVTPPADITASDGKRAPSKVLLRIYGPQVEHLIDRDNELSVLRRLAKKRIGPRLLGTFENGRFEQYFNAITLTPKDLREAETSRQIAKRMRELHDGVELLPAEREAGPNVWRNWDKWHDKVAMIVPFLDHKLEASGRKVPGPMSVNAWMGCGYVCGVPWAQFEDTIEKYRTHLYNYYHGEKTVHEGLVFAHNDTQYGNILRIRPDDEKSPLLQAANKHKQLIVIDFEYSAANLPGQEFANHFTEWTYNYHDPVMPWACNPRRYPTPEEQSRFLKAYADHRPQFPHVSSTPRLIPVDAQSSGSKSTPSLVPSTSSSSIVDFMLDSRAPHGGWSALENDREEQTDRKVKQLMEEARLWRAANSAMWVAWGIVQAKIPGLLDENATPGVDDFAAAAAAPSSSTSSVADGYFDQEDGSDEDEEIGPDEFDYLRYSQDRVFFFWGDMVRMGLVKADELPEMLRKNLKIVEY